MNGEEDRGTQESLDTGTTGEIPENDAPRRMADWGCSVTAYIVEHPEVCLGIAVALGVAIGLAVKRR